MYVLVAKFKKIGNTSLPKLLFLCGKRTDAGHVLAEVEKSTNSYLVKSLFHPKNFLFAYLRNGSHNEGITEDQRRHSEGT